MRIEFKDGDIQVIYAEERQNTTKEYDKEMINLVEEKFWKIKNCNKKENEGDKDVRE